MRYYIVNLDIYQSVFKFNNLYMRYTTKEKKAKQ